MFDDRFKSEKRPFIILFLCFILYTLTFNLHIGKGI